MLKDCQLCWCYCR